MLIGLTGGVGSGKSTVAALLAAHGAVVVDADQVAREVVEPGTRGHTAIVERFGADVALQPDGTLDRAGIAAIVFHDSDALADLNAIVHPLVAARSAEHIADAPRGSIVVYDVPLLVESGTLGRFPFERLVVVEAEVETRVGRLIARGLDEADARARIAAQATDEQRRELADEVILNDGDREQLASAVDALWAGLSAHNDHDGEAS
jgi:dephospho-CoA kinase